MALLYLADATALIALSESLDPDAADDLWPELTQAVEDLSLGFPRSVVDDLKVRARGHQIISWVHGLGTSLNGFRPNVKHWRWLMREVQRMGFESGFESIDGDEPSISHVCLCARQLELDDREFMIVTEDSGLNPLRPTLCAICDEVGWQYCDTRSCIAGLGLDRYLK